MLTKATIKKKVTSALLALILTLTCLGALSAVAETETPAPNYSREENWAYFAVGTDKNVDLFLICPTVDVKDEFNMSLDDEETRGNFVGALNMERGIYEDCARMYAPFYRQAAMKVYALDEDAREPYLSMAYEDISSAFSWYVCRIMM